MLQFSHTAPEGVNMETAIYAVVEIDGYEENWERDFFTTLEQATAWGEYHLDGLRWEVRTVQLHS